MVTIKDSGERTEFASGAVRDMHDGKGRMDLLPWAAIMEVSKHCEAGAKKYGEHNVDKGIPTSSLCDSGMRHLAKYLDGWTDENHLVAAAWNLLWALEMVAKHPECVNTPWKLMEPKKTCPCCGYEMKPGYKECPNCLVYSGEDDFWQKWRRSDGD